MRSHQLRCSVAQHALRYVIAGGSVGIVAANKWGSAELLEKTTGAMVTLGPFLLQMKASILVVLMVLGIPLVLVKLAEKLQLVLL